MAVACSLSSRKLRRRSSIRSSGPTWKVRLSDRRVIRCPCSSIGLADASSSLARGYKITYESPKNDKLSLFKHGDRAYDHIVLLPTKSKGHRSIFEFYARRRADSSPGLGPALTPNLLLRFVNQDGNILLALSAENPIPTAISSLLLELDIHLPPDRTSLVVDHFNHDSTSVSDRHDVLLLPQPSSSRPDVRSFFGGDGTIAFPRAVAQELGESSPLLAPVLRAKSTAYSFNPKEDGETAEDPFLVGEQISLVSTMQARNSARLTVFGSVEALENEWFDAKVKDLAGKSSKTANREFAKQISAWTFKELGVLRVGRVEHHLSMIEGDGGGNDSVVQLSYLNPTIYRIKNDVVSSDNQHPFRQHVLITIF